MVKAPEPTFEIVARYSPGSLVYPSVMLSILSISFFKRYQNGWKRSRVESFTASFWLLEFAVSFGMQLLWNWWDSTSRPHLLHSIGEVPCWACFIRRHSGHQMHPQGLSSTWAPRYGMALSHQQHLGPLLWVSGSDDQRNCLAPELSERYRLVDMARMFDVFKGRAMPIQSYLS